MPRYSSSHLPRRIVLYAVLLTLCGALTGCALDVITGLASPPATTPSNPLYEDVMGVHAGVCFEAAYELRDQVQVMSSAAEHIAFYDRIDAAGWCRWPVERRPFDFETGALLAGLWSYGSGCTARHDVLTFSRDDAARHITIELAFVTDGDCPYELLRPFWVRLPDAQGYTVTLDVTRN